MKNFWKSFNPEKIFIIESDNVQDIIKSAEINSDQKRNIFCNYGV